MSKFRGDVNLPKLIYRGAEAEIYLEKWCEEVAVRKSRISKPYRVPELDASLRRSRMLREISLMHEARKIGVPVPVVEHVDRDESSFVMEYVNGPTLKDELYEVSPTIRQQRCKQLGELVAMLHEGGVVHGDLTISNVICQDGKLFLIDFGLGDVSSEMEDRGVDLLLLNRAMKSTHVKFYEESFSAFLKGYSSTVGKELGVETIEKMREIERRGRYFERA